MAPITRIAIASHTHSGDASLTLLMGQRSADVWADTPATCLELPLDSFADYRQLHPQIAMRIMRNLSALMARRLILANAKVDLLSAY